MKNKMKVEITGEQLMDLIKSGKVSDRTGKGMFVATVRVTVEDNVQKSVFGHPPKAVFGNYPRYYIEIEFSESGEVQE